MTTPVLQRLHELYPAAKIDIVADKRSVELLEPCPFVDRIVLKIKKSGFKGLLKLVSELRQKRYDLIVDLRTDGLSWLLKGKKRLTKRLIDPSATHSVEQHYSIIRSITGEADPIGTKLWLSDAHRKEAEAIIPDADNILAIGPGANWEGKIWPAEYFSQLINSLSEQFDHVVFLGGPQDQERVSQVQANIQLPSTDLSAKTSLLTATAVLERSKLFVGNDSGLGHLASAVGTTAITVFGPGQPQKYHPWGKQHIWCRAPSEQLQDLKSDVVARSVQQSLNQSL